MKTKIKKLVRGDNISAAVLCAIAALAVSFVVIAENILFTKGADALGIDQSITIDAEDMKPAEIRKPVGVTLTVNGKTVSATTTGESVGALLSRINVIVGPYDSVSPPLDAQVDKNTEIEVITAEPAVQLISKAIPADPDDKTSMSESVPLSAASDGMDYRNVVMSHVKKAPTPRPSTSRAGSSPLGASGVVGGNGTITLASGETLSYSRVLDVQATAYTTEGYKQKRNALGKIARVGTIAVDPRVIPLRSKVYITSRDGTSWFYGIAVCEDTGGVIKGNIIDLFFDTRAECFNFGRRMAKVYILE